MPKTDKRIGAAARAERRTRSAAGRFLQQGNTKQRTDLPDQVAAVLARARESGLTQGKGGRIAGRVSPDLIRQAKARTGLQSDTELVEFALANVAIEDDFARVFREVRGAVDPGLDLEA